MKKIRNQVIYMIIIAAIIAVLATACQPTPPKPVVPNKDNGELEAAIRQTPQPAEDIAVTAEPPQSIHLTDSRTNDAGNITVNIDADVIPQGEGDVVVARLERCTFTKEHLDRAVIAFFGNNITYYDPSTQTKADYDQYILQRQQLMTDKEAMLKCDYAVNSGTTDIEKIKRHIQGVIDRLVKERKKAPDERPTLVPDYHEGFGARVDNGDEYMGSAFYNSTSERPSMGLSAFGGEYASEGRWLTYKTSTRIDGTDPALTTARDRAQSFMDAVGIEGVRLGDCFISEDCVSPHPYREQDVVSDRTFYVFCYEREVGDRSIDHSFYEGVYTDDSEISVTLPYEDIQVWVEGDKVINFVWKNPHRIIAILNENTAVQTTYEQALETTIHQLFIKYAYAFEDGRAESIHADIQSIEFDLIRMKEKNSNDYISVPVWKLYGDVRMKYSQAYKDKINSTIDCETGELCVAQDYRALEYPNFMTINALDGSIIDMSKGY